MSFKTNFSLLISCLDDLSIDISGVLKSPNIIVLLSISPYMSVNICFIYLSVPIISVFMLMNAISSSCIGAFFTI